MNLILFGPPGAGKGTQAQFLVKKYNLIQITTGELLRNKKKKKSVLGKDIENIISKGNLVSDQIVNDLLKIAISNLNMESKVIFDGYPRNIEQANNLQKILKQNQKYINFIIYLNVKREIIEKRIMGRVTCDKCNITLNEFFNIKEINNHKCGKENLKRRKDDNLETVLTRYDNYMIKTKPVLDFYSKHANFHEIDGSSQIDQINNKIEGFLNV